MSSLLITKIENISRKILEDYTKELMEVIGKSHGIYALYNGDDLYYVGRSIDLKQRVKYHLRDRHGAQWTHFSLYLTKKESYTKDIESIIIDIASPKGNRQKGKIGDKKLRKILKEKVIEKNKREIEEIFGKKKKSSKKTKVKKKSLGNVSLKGRFPTPRPLLRTYKGKDYKATLLTSGKIKYEGKIYNSPSSAGKAVTNKETNGWDFWFIQDEMGNWVSLSSIRDKIK